MTFTILYLTILGHFCLIWFVFSFGLFLSYYICSLLSTTSDSNKMGGWEGDGSIFLGG